MSSTKESPASGVASALFSSDDTSLAEGFRDKVAALHTFFDRDTADLRAANTECNNLKRALDECNSGLIERCGGEAELAACDIDLGGILDVPPNAYPCPVDMDPDAIQKHVLNGRRAELSLLLYNVQSCGCCGRVKPGHSDPSFPSKDAPFKRMHLMNDNHPAWHCTCSGFCKGSQFYALNRRSVMTKYRDEHGGLSPEQFEEQHPNTVTKTVMCQKCYDEVTSDNVDDLQHGFIFSARNGFGPLEAPPSDVGPNDDVNVVRSRELYELLSALTAAEEAAIRQICPLVSIVRLTCGNIGSKGNTSCVWQHSKLTRVLPNLPSQCNYIILKRGNASTDNMKATRFSRSKIQKVLTLLKETGHEVWNDIEISDENLASWPEEGNLMDIVENLVVEEVDNEPVSDGSDTNEVGATTNASDSAAIELDADGDDFGPAPLQNDVVQDETFEGVIPANARTQAGAANAHLIANAVNAAVQSIRDGAGQAGTATNPTNANNNNNNQTVNIYANAGENLPAPQLNANQTTATFQHNDVLRVDGFVDMNRTPYAWARAFPTIFIPTYTIVNHSTGEMGWQIHHDITGWSNPRDKIVGRNQWYEYMMWRSDGRPAAHPTFGLVLFNHKVNNYLHRQGQYLINTSEFDTSVTVNQIKNATDDATIRKLVQQLLEKALVHSGNHAGTAAFQKAMYHEFKAHCFYQQYMHNRDIDAFLTGSLAEYHEPYLRFLLAKYVSQLSPPPTDIDPLLILTDDNVFCTAVQRYKNIVTNYLVSKEEIWFAYMYKLNHGVIGGNLAHEFAKSRGAVHYHATCQTESECMDEVGSALKTLSITISDAMDRLHEFINQRFQQELHKDNPAECFSKSALKVREEFCKKVEGGVEAWEEYVSTTEAAKKACSKAVGRALESHFGLHAMHTGNAPSDWVKPGGQALGEPSNYRGTDASMQSSSDVRDFGELKKPKWYRENDLYGRHANICNHCGSHKCSGYCWREQELVRKFNAEKDADVPEEQQFERSGKRYVRTTLIECRMHFGRKLPYDSSGENNLTGGQDRRENFELCFDKNGMPRIYAARNHPRVLQEPYAFAWYGANNDYSFMLHCKCGRDLMQTKGMRWYEKYSNNLVAAGCSGLEQYSGSYMTTEYLSGYQCKGNESSHNFSKMVSEFFDKYSSDEANDDKNIRSIMSKCMSEVMKGESKSRDECIFILSGAKQKRCSYESTKKCSVSSVRLSDLTADAVSGGGEEGNSDEGTSDSSFTWANITKKYSKRSLEDEGLNLYKFVALKWKPGKETVPQFFGYSNHSSWPPSEEYSKWMLTFYKPWRDNFSEVKEGFPTYSAALMVYYKDPNFPDSIRSELWRKKRKEAPIELGESGINADIAGDANHYTPNDERVDNANDDANDAAQLAGDAAEAAGILGGEDPNSGDMEDIQFDQLQRLPPDDYDWSSHYLPEKKDALVTFSKQYYASRNELIISRERAGNNAVNEPLTLFEPDKCKPENVRTEGQKLLIYHHLHSQWMLHKFNVAKAAYENDPDNNEQPPPRPPCQHVLVEGIPGVGKTFIINTVRNITRTIHQRNASDSASAPTGCAAALINGSTNARTFQIPSGKSFFQPPVEISNTNTSQYLATRASFCNVITRQMDESSMNGRSDYAWFEQRDVEFRQAPSEIVSNEDFEMSDEEDLQNLEPQQAPAVLLDAEVCSRSHAGIPFFNVYGDTNQLPPVMKAPVYSQVTPKPSTSDMLGKAVFINDFWAPNTDELESYVVLMEDVLRQNDEDFLSLLDHMRKGEMNEDDVNLLLSRQIDRLPPAERKTFEDESLHLVPTWRAASGIIFNYLQNTLTEPIVKFQSSYDTSRRDQKNCCLRESRYPKQHALCVGAKVMLLKNFVVELGLMNGAVGVVKYLCYNHRNGPYPQENDEDDIAAGHISDVLQYAIVDFPDCLITEEQKFFPGLPRTCVPIPMVIERCEKKCCSVTTLPLRCCKALSIHKSQGMTIGPGKPFQYVTVHYPTSNSGLRSCPGLELVATSRVVDLKYLAVGNMQSDLSRQQLTSIGKSKAYDSRKVYLAKVRAEAEKSEAELKEKIASADPSIAKTYEGGCKFLLDWYNSIRNGNIT